MCNIVIQKVINRKEKQRDIKILVALQQHFLFMNDQSVNSKFIKCLSQNQRIVLLYLYITCNKYTAKADGNVVIRFRGQILS